MLEDTLQDPHATNKFDFKYEHKSHDIYIYDDKSVDVFSFGIMVFEICLYDTRLEIPKYNTCQNKKWVL